MRPRGESLACSVRFREVHVGGKPLALAVIGGLTLSTFITLLVMSVLYSLLERRSA